jgi:PhoPQ-activated pathogenicity-related protein
MALLLMLVAGLSWVTVDAQSYTWADETPLDTYVQRDDGYFSWQYLATYDYDGVSVHIVNMTSQMWQTDTFVSKSVWWHLMGVAIPNTIRHQDSGFLFIDGGSNRDTTEIPPMTDLGNLAVALLANDTGTCGAYIKQVPNQPIVFSNDPTQRSRSEDSIIAWTWRTFIDSANPDPTVILRMPMTKAAKRGLDTVHAVAKDKAPSTHITKFIVSGASKRGWTTWSIASTDRRVIAIIPMVFSLLNIEEAVQKHFQNMNGAYSFAFSPYWNENLTREFFTPETDGVWNAEDMYRYRARLAGVYKLELVSSGDEFFLCDDSLQWWTGMPDPKWMLMLPNSEHSMAPHYLKIYTTAASFWLSILTNVALPSVTWTMQETAQGGLIVVDTVPKPRNITAWSTTTLGNDTRRDFRLAALASTGDVVLHPVVWRQDINVVDFGNGLQYGAVAPKVAGEWVGYFVQGTWDGPPPLDNYRMVFTTQVNVIPYTYPRGPCVDNADCYGYLV